MLSDVRIDGYFTGHSLCRTGTTRMFQGGIDRKIVKEITGHRSDAVDAYQVTSAAQKRKVSDIIARKSSTCTISERNITEKYVNQDQTEDNVTKVKENETNTTLVSVKQRDGSEVTNMKVEDIGCMITSVLKKNVTKGKTKIKIEIEIEHE